jgi:hypothetical protein
VPLFFDRGVLAVGYACQARADVAVLQSPGEQAKAKHMQEVMAALESDNHHSGVSIRFPTHRGGTNIKKLPLISHKAAANRTDALKVLAA